MSANSTWKHRTGKIMTDPKWIPITQGMNKWVNKMAQRQDLSIRVLKETSGAPARFIASEAVIDINESVFLGIDPKLAGSQEFIALFPGKAGIPIHEAACHAQHSKFIDLERMVRLYGAKHTMTFLVLEEGRCESLAWPGLTKAEQFALRSMVLSIVIQDLPDPENTEEEADLGNPQQAIRLLGLIAARVNTGIIDPTEPAFNKLWVAMIGAMGDWFTKFYNIAVEFSKQKVDYWHTDEPRMHELVEEWIALEKEALGKNEEPGGPGGKEPGTEEGEEPGEGKGKGKGEEEGEEKEGNGNGSGSGEEEEEGQGGGGGGGEKEEEEEGESPSEGEEGDEEKEGQGDGDGDDDGKPGEGEEGDEEVGDDDEGVEGDGSRKLNDGDGGPGLGDYKSGTSEGIDMSGLEDVLKGLNEAQEEARKINGSRLGEELKAMHKASASAHAERRKANAEAAKIWKKRG